MKEITVAKKSAESIKDEMNLTKEGRLAKQGCEGERPKSLRFVYILMATLRYARYIPDLKWPDTWLVKRNAGVQNNEHFTAILAETQWTLLQGLYDAMQNSDAEENDGQVSS